jgi:hypothetical protein
MQRCANLALPELDKATSYTILGLGPTSKETFRDLKEARDHAHHARFMFSKSPWIATLACSGLAS